MSRELRESASHYTERFRGQADPLLANVKVIGSTVRRRIAGTRQPELGPGGAAHPEPADTARPEAPPGDTTRPDPQPAPAWTDAAPAWTDAPPAPTWAETPAPAPAWTDQPPAPL